jgi:hypothetical protein
MRRVLRALLALVAAGMIASPLACASTLTATPPVECGAGTVSCTMDSKCCPASDPFFCGGPTDPDNFGCYATLQDAASVCGTESFNGKTMTIAYPCH